MRRGGASRIFILHDHATPADDLRRSLAAHPDLRVCGAAADPRTALEALDGARADLVVVASGWRANSGSGVIRHICARYPGTAVLVVDSEEEAAEVERVLRAGATGYLTPREVDQLPTAVRHLLRGQVYLSPRLMAGVLERLIAAPRRRIPPPFSPDNDPLRLLDELELRLFVLLGQRRGRGEIASTLQVSRPEVEAAIDRIVAKLRMPRSGDLVRFAVRWVRARDDVS